ncbi:MAG: AmmeMemoRadiSam system protein B, partial [Deltaproteobacteria bacterium]|nr:AmmeMemoRadiSam system protein B [Deltaproteobacteria bacterium]
KKAGPLLKVLNEIISQEQETTLIVAGVDFSHVGPKFGHDSPARYLSAQSEAHDKNLLDHLVGLDADRFWEESIRVEDRFNVCGFSALACFLEILPQSRGKVLHYETWYEEPTKSAVSFASAVFTRQ